MQPSNEQRCPFEFLKGQVQRKVTVLLSINDVFAHVSTILYKVQKYLFFLHISISNYLLKALLNDTCAAGHVRQVYSGTGWRHEGILQMWKQYRFGRRGKGYSQHVYFEFI